MLTKMGGRNVKIDIARHVPYGAFVRIVNFKNQVKLLRVIDKDPGGGLFLENGRHIPSFTDGVHWDDYAYGFLCGQDRIG